MPFIDLARHINYDIEILTNAQKNDITQVSPATIKVHPRAV